MPSLEADKIGTILTDQGKWEINFIANEKVWLEVYRSPAGYNYLILFTDLFCGLIIDRSHYVPAMTDRLEITLEVCEQAMSKELEPESVLAMAWSHAHQNVVKSIEKLCYEAQFLKKKILGVEILQVVCQARLKIARAEKVHKEAIVKILEAQAGGGKDEKGKRSIRCSSETVSSSQPKVRGVRATGDGLPPQGRKRGKSSSGGNVRGPVSGVSRQSSRKPRVGKGK